jgi:hypothetical protein
MGTGTTFLTGKQLQCKTDHKVKNTWSFISILHICLHIIVFMHANSFISKFYYLTRTKTVTPLPSTSLLKQSCSVQWCFYICISNTLHGVLSWKVEGTWLGKNWPPFMESEVSLTRSEEPTLGPYASWVQSTPSYTISSRFILTLSSHLCLDFTNSLFPSCFKAEFYAHFWSHHVYYIPTNLI